MRGRNQQALHFALSSGQPALTPTLQTPSPKPCSSGITQSIQTSLAALLLDPALVPGLGPFWGTWAPAAPLTASTLLAASSPCRGSLFLPGWLSPCPAWQKSLNPLLAGIFCLSTPTTLLSTLRTEIVSVFKVMALPTWKVLRAFLTAPLPALHDTFSPV